MDRDTESKLLNTLSDSESAILDGYASVDAIQDLGLVTRAKNLREESLSAFKSFIERQFVIVYPDSALSQLKDSANAKSLVVYSLNNIYVSWQIWKGIIGHLFKTCSKVCSNFIPVQDFIITDLTKMLGRSSVIQNSPFYNLLTNTKDTLGYIVYGLSHGVHELAYFISSKVQRLDYIYEYTMSPESDGRCTETTLSYTEKEKSPVTHKSTSDDRSFKGFKINLKSRVNESKSIFTNESFNSLFGKLFSLIQKDSTEVKWGQYNSSERTGFVSKDKSNTIFTEGFKVSAIVNNEIAVTLADRVIVDIMVGLCHFIDSYKDSPDFDRKLDDVLNYSSTVIHEFVKSKPILNSTITIRSLKFNITFERKVNDRSRLVSIFTRMVHDGHLILMTPIQYSFLFTGGALDVKWIKFIAISMLSCPYGCTELDPILPGMSVESKDAMRSLLRNVSLLNSSYYHTAVILPFQLSQVVKLSVNDVLTEIYIRILTRDSLDPCLPLLTRGNWRGVNGRSPTVYVPYINTTFAKFGLLDYYNVMQKFVANICYRTEGPSPVKTSPTYIKGIARSSEKLPAVLEFFIPLSLIHI